MSCMDVVSRTIVVCGMTLASLQCWDEHGGEEGVVFRPKRVVFCERYTEARCKSKLRAHDIRSE